VVWAVWLLFSSQLILKSSTSIEVLYRFGIKENYHEVLEKKHLESSWKETPKQVMPSYYSYPQRQHQRPVFGPFMGCNFNDSTKNYTWAQWSSKLRFRTGFGLN
jgi:hypothetical protein